VCQDIRTAIRLDHGIAIQQTQATFVLVEYALLAQQQVLPLQMTHVWKDGVIVTMTILQVQTKVVQDVNATLAAGSSRAVVANALQRQHALQNQCVHQAWIAVQARDVAVDNAKTAQVLEIALAAANAARDASAIAQN
jgi:ribosomal protein L3